MLLLSTVRKYIVCSCIYITYIISGLESQRQESSTVITEQANSEEALRGDSGAMDPVIDHQTESAEEPHGNSGALDPVTDRHTESAEEPRGNSGALNPVTDCHTESAEEQTPNQKDTEQNGDDDCQIRLDGDGEY